MKKVIGGLIVVHRYVGALRRLFDTMVDDQGLALDTLSIGMSDDLEAAVAEGSTMVRIGTAIFGARATS